MGRQFGAVKPQVCNRRGWQPIGAIGEVHDHYRGLQPQDLLRAEGNVALVECGVRLSAGLPR
jgi:hypothetical protein